MLKPADTLTCTIFPVWLSVAELLQYLRLLCASELRSLRILHLFSLLVVDAAIRAVLIWCKKTTLKEVELPQEGRLAHLRYLVWQDAPAGELQALSEQCPRLLLNPAPRRGVPAVADAGAALDEPTLDAIAHLGPFSEQTCGMGDAPESGEAAAGGPACRCGQGGGPVQWGRAANSRWSGVVMKKRNPDPSAAPAGPSLAERFAAAYASRAAKLSAEHTRNVRRAERRRVAEMGGAERALRMAELGVPLARLRR